MQDPPITKVISREGWAGPDRHFRHYSKSEKKDLLSTIKSRMPEFSHLKDKEIICEIENIVSKLSVSQRKDSPEIKGFSKSKTNKIIKKSKEFSSSLKEIDNDILENLDLQIIGNSELWDSEEFESLRTKLDQLSYVNISILNDTSKLVENVLLLHEALALMLPHVKTPKGGRPTDELLFSTIVLLSKYYSKLTGKKARRGGPLQTFIQIALAPHVAEGKNDATHYLKLIKKMDRTG